MRKERGEGSFEGTIHPLFFFSEVGENIARLERMSASFWR
jgi:predicted short-subunit dehydrogenase-like oxidoreductase (DUF2520 family)